ARKGSAATARTVPPSCLISCRRSIRSRGRRGSTEETVLHLSFFDEDDEPRTRVRPRRSSTATAGRPDRQTVLVRQLVLLGGFILIVALLIFVVNGCRNSAKEN